MFDSEDVERFRYGEALSFSHLQKPGKQSYYYQAALYAHIFCRVDAAAAAANSIQSQTRNRIKHFQMKDPFLVLLSPSRAALFAHLV